MSLVFFFYYDDKHVSKTVTSHHSAIKPVQLWQGRQIYTVVKATLGL